MERLGRYHDVSGLGAYRQRERVRLHPWPDPAVGGPFEHAEGQIEPADEAVHDPAGARGENPCPATHVQDPPCGFSAQLRQHCLVNGSVDRPLNDGHVIDA